MKYKILLAAAILSLALSALVTGFVIMRITAEYKNVIDAEKRIFIERETPLALKQTPRHLEPEIVYLSGETKQTEYTTPPKPVFLDTFIATAYCDTGLTATGTTTTEHRTLAVNPSDIPYGSHVWLYTEDGELIGDYWAEDTGGNLLRQHYIVDIYMPDYDDCIAWGERRVAVYLESN